jgi:hypothetical protein
LPVAGISELERLDERLREALRHGRHHVAVVQDVPDATKCGTVSRTLRTTPLRSSNSSTLPWPVPSDTTTTWSAEENSANETLRLSRRCPLRNMQT